MACVSSLASLLEMTERHVSSLAGEILIDFRQSIKLPFFFYKDMLRRKNLRNILLVASFQ